MYIKQVGWRADQDQVEGCASRTKRRTILRSRPLGMQTSYRARISRILASLSIDCHGSLSLFHSFHSRFQLLSHLAYARPAHFLAFSLPRFLVRVCDPPSDVNLSRSLRLLTPLHRRPHTYICISMCTCACTRCIGQPSRRAHALYALLTFYHPYQKRTTSHPLSPSL